MAMVYTVTVSKDKQMATVTDRRNGVKKTFPVAAFDIRGDSFDPATFQFPMAIADKVRRLCDE